MSSSETDQSAKYFLALGSALEGLDTYLQEEQSPAYQHGVIAAVFRVSQTESGFPAFQNVLDLQNDRALAGERLAGFDDEDTIRENMVDHILSKKTFPADLQKSMAERHYLQTSSRREAFFSIGFAPHNSCFGKSKNATSFYVVHWGFYDGAANLPMIYMATIEDSSDDIKKTLVSPSGKLNKHVNIKLPVEWLVEPGIGASI
ncbi:hypothetical protein GQR58_004407 [Nymphon striatum]|nr:hypothetical protein GQR58_004407 [Nymphon striatum]